MIISAFFNKFRTVLLTFSILFCLAPAITFAYVPVDGGSSTTTSCPNHSFSYRKDGNINGCFDEEKSKLYFTLSSKSTSVIVYGAMGTKEADGGYWDYKLKITRSTPSKGTLSETHYLSDSLPPKTTTNPNTLVSISGTAPDFDKVTKPASSSSSGSSSSPNPVNLSTAFQSMFGGCKKTDPATKKCVEYEKCDTYECWLNLVWKWAFVIVVPLSVLVLTAAGVVWMSSEGNPDRIALAKKLIMGVVSGVALLLVAKVIFNLIGIDSSWNITP